MKLDPNHLSALRGVLHHGSFEAAAHALGVTPSAISQRIKALEDRTGIALVLRGAPCTGTAAGLVAQVNGGDVAVDALFSGAATVCLLTMVPLALGGIWAAWRPRGVPDERPVSPGRRQAS